MAAGYQDGYKVNGNPLHHLYFIVDGKTTEMTGLIDGNCLTIQRAAQKNTPVVTYEGDVVINQSANDSATATVTAVEGLYADRLCTALFNDQFDAKEHNVDIVYTNEATGFTAKAEHCYAQNDIETTMANTVGQPAYPLIVTKYRRNYDGDTVEKLLNS